MWTAPYRVAFLTRLLAATAALSIPAMNACAQSAVGLPMNAATGRSMTDAVDQNERDFVDREVHGRGLGTSGGAAGLAGLNAFTSGRLRTSDHNGIRPLTNTSFSYRTNEASVFGNVVATIPGTALGGLIKVSAFAGYNGLSLKLRSNDVAVLDPDQFAKAKNQSFMAGTSALWASQGYYVLGSAVGSWGQTMLTDGFDDCGPCTTNIYTFSTTGFVGTITAGKVFDMPGAAGPKIDVRGSLGYTQNNASPFKNINKGGGDVEQKYTFSTWNGTMGVTLFTNQTLQNSAVLSPYARGYLRQELGYRNQIDATEPDGTFTRTLVDQKHLYGGVDIGVTYTLDKMTAGAALYVETSGDERTLGGRIGLSWKFN